MENFIKFRVVENLQKQYSLWPFSKDIPTGWHDTGVFGSKEECLQFIEEKWLDMRPLIVQEYLQQISSNNNGNKL